MVFISLLLKTLILATMNFNVALTGWFSNDKNNIVKKRTKFLALRPIFHRLACLLVQMGLLVSTRQGHQCLLCGYDGATMRQKSHQKGRLSRIPRHAEQARGNIGVSVWICHFHGIGRHAPVIPHRVGYSADTIATSRGIEYE